MSHFKGIKVYIYRYLPEALKIILIGAAPDRGESLYLLSFKKTVF
jgi:hypothetical protein